MPELNESLPVTPLVPPLAANTHTEPLLLAVPSPLNACTVPPEVDALRPAAAPRITLMPLVPLPAAIRIDPPLPWVAIPVLNATRPLFPLDAVPLLNSSRPPEPSPLSMPNMQTEPLLNKAPPPALARIIPPVARILRPDKVATGVPMPLVPLPALTITLPLRPVPVAALGPMHTKPLFPVTDEPELNLRKPLAPEIPLFMELILITPLLVAVPSPALMKTQPPLEPVL